MKRFTWKLLLFLSPLLFVLFIYLYKDPFRVLYHYSAYYQPSDSLYFFLNDDYVAAQTLIQEYPADSMDSYIFGSSRANGYMVSEWGKYINSKKCYHFNVAWETLYGVEKKFQFLNKRHYPIKNALIAIDAELLRVTNNGTGHLRLKGPLLSDQSMWQFQTEFLKDFLDKDFLFSYLDLLFSGHIKPYMVKNGTINFMKFNYNVATNENSLDIESEVDRDSAKFYSERSAIFYQRDSTEHIEKPVVGNKQIELLTSIKNILDKNKTNYRIVINPLYNQLKLNAADLEILNRIFGQRNVYDFSGINFITRSKYNYLETSHFRTRIHSKILGLIYK